MSQQEPNKSTEKSSSGFKTFFKGHLGKVIGGVIALILFLIITNPSLIPFLSANTKASLKNTWSKLGGDVSKISGALKINLVTLFQVIAIILMLVIITNLILFILNKLKPKKPKAKSAVSLAKSAISYIMTIIGIFWCLSALGVNLSTIFASVGIIALIIGFGAQSLVEDLVTGIFLVFEDQFNVGDIIEVNGFRGTVDSIGIRATCIRDVGNNVKIINNSDLRNILNRSTADSYAVTTVSISYKENLEHIEEVVSEFLPKIREKYPEVFVKDPVYCGVQELGESGMLLKFVALVKESNIFTAPRLLNREIKIAFDKAGIEIPFNQIVVHNADK
ncbi:MAG: mechanosensitive ion channel family protein [Oscillospiraceae bacterium]|nr:mechanosensitive ion channel family protein [Oscillospiraceae bacterium]